MTLQVHIFGGRKMKKRKVIIMLLCMLLAIAAVCIPCLAEEAQESAEAAEAVSPFLNSFWALVPPIIAILLALITKEVYSSLFIGIAAGALLLKNFQLENAMNRLFTGGFIASVTDAIMKEYLFSLFFLV